MPYKTLAIFGDEALTSTDLLIIGTFLLIVGYLAKRRKVGVIRWTSAEKEGISEETMGNIAGISVMVIGGLSYLFAVVLLADVPAKTVEILYYASAVIVVIFQTIAVKIA
jgi:uncharacterized membrane protein